VDLHLDPLAVGRLLGLLAADLHLAADPADRLPGLLVVGLADRLLARQAVDPAGLLLGLLAADLLACLPQI
jgi:hypothetical protein